eukprot:scaffold2549_cov108-Isochrysis_galbana.AAC.3
MVPRRATDHTAQALCRCASCSACPRGRPLLRSSRRSCRGLLAPTGSRTTARHWPESNACRSSRKVGASKEEGRDGRRGWRRTRTRLDTGRQHRGHGVAKILERRWRERLFEKSGSRRMTLCRVGFNVEKLGEEYVPQSADTFETACVRLVACARDDLRLHILIISGDIVRRVS